MDHPKMPELKSVFNAHRKKYIKKYGKAWILIPIFSLCLFLFLNDLFAQEKKTYPPYPDPMPKTVSSAQITKEVDQQKNVSGNQKNLEKEKRNTVQAIQNAAINSGLYLQGTNEKFDENITWLHFYDYCDNAAAGEGDNGFTCDRGGDPLFAHGDIKLSTLLSSSNLTKDEKNAASDFMRNLVQPRPGTMFGGANIDKLKLNDEGTGGINDPAVQREMADLLIQQAILSVAREPLAQMVAMRTPGTESDDAEKIAENPSMMTQMEQQANQRFLNDEWYDTLKKNKKSIEDYLADKGKKDYTVTALLPLFDIVTMDAYRTWLETQRYKQGERIEALLSAILVEINKQSKGAEALVSKTQSVTGNPPQGGSGNPPP